MPVLLSATSGHKLGYGRTRKHMFLGVCVGELVRPVFRTSFSPQLIASTFGSGPCYWEGWREVQSSSNRESFQDHIGRY
jgi:hypothetical protein